MQTTKDQTLETMVKHYLICALWTSYDDNGENCPPPLDDNYSLEDISAETYFNAKNDCIKFLKDAENSCPKELLEEFYTYDNELMGHNFFLNRNRHGSGFWDEKGYSKELGNYLSDICHKMGEVNFYVGDDKKIYSA